MPSVEIGKPNSMRLQEILKMIDGAEMKLPEFQRDFRWEIGDVIELIISIMRGFPAGVLLFWDVRGAESRLAERLFDGVNESRKNETKYLVLDGQQRLSSLYQLFHTEYVDLKGDRRRKFFLNLQKLKEEKLDEAVEYFSETEVRKQKLDSKETQVSRELIPFSVLAKPDEFREWKARYAKYKLYQGNVNEYQDNVSALMNQFEKDFLDEGKPIWNLHEYLFHYIELPPSLGLEAVTTIFEKLNTTGQPLNIFEILTAKFYTDINLREKWEKTLQRYDIINRFKKDKKDTTLAILILKAILLKKSIDRPELRTLECKRRDLLESLSPSDINDYWDDVAGSFSKSLNKLNDEYGSPSLDYLPYATILVPMSVIVNYVENKVHFSKRADAYNKIKSWYWSSVLSGAYDSATDTRSKNDVNQLISWIDEGKSPPVVNEFSVESINFEEITSGAKYTGILSILIQNGCSDFCTGEPIGTMIRVESREVDIHHVFPIKFLERHYGRESEQFKKRDTILNKVLIRKETNRNYIKDDPPTLYLEGIKKVNPNVEELFKGHLLPANLMKSDNFDAFLEERKSEIVEKVKELVHA
jgi:hypothetical protein